MVDPNELMDKSKDRAYMKTLLNGNKRGRKEILAPYIDVIRSMRTSGRSYKDIHKFLNANDIKVSLQVVYNFCKRNFKSSKKRRISEKDVK